MSTQTESMRKSDHITVQPPVIIKSGGGGGDPTKINVEFNGNGMIFDSPRQPAEWQFSTSSVPARIMSLEILDGRNTLGPFNADSPTELAVLQVSFLQAALVVSDIPLDEISITSPVLFKVTQPGPGPDQWTGSQTQFPTVAPFVLFTQGGRELVRHQCESIDVTLNLYVSRLG